MKKEITPVDFTKPLPGFSDDPDFLIFLQRAKNLKLLKKDKTTEPYLKKTEDQILFANYAYLIWEYLNHWYIPTRGYELQINYSQVKDFAAKFREELEYIFSTDNHNETRYKIARWFYVPIDMTPIAMYAGTTNSSNKHSYH